MKLTLAAFATLLALPLVSAHAGYEDGFARLKSKQKKVEALREYREVVAMKYGASVANDISSFIELDGRHYGVGSSYVCEAKMSLRNGGKDVSYALPIDGECASKSELQEQ